MNVALLKIEQSINGERMSQTSLFTSMEGALKHIRYNDSRFTNFELQKMSDEHYFGMGINRNTGNSAIITITLEQVFE